MRTIIIFFILFNLTSANAEKISINEEQLSLDLQKALNDMSLRDASEAVAQAYGLPKRQIYQKALELGKDSKR